MGSKEHAPEKRRPGRPKGSGGRPKGVQNKLTRSVKEAIFQAFEGAGGVRYLLEVAREDPRTFCTLLGKLVPHEVSGSIGLTHEKALEELERAAKG